MSFMNIEKLFQVIVVMGASSTAGLAACGSSTTGTNGPSSDDSDSSSGATGEACTAVCHPDPQTATWTDCNGCCCWLPAGSTSPFATPICGTEPCCAGRGR